MNGQIEDFLIATNNVLILLIPATCCLVAVDAILKSLNITKSNIKKLTEALTHPELHFIQTNLLHPLLSADDLLQINPLASLVMKRCIPQIVVYSGAQNNTLTTLQVLKRN